MKVRSPRSFLSYWKPATAAHNLGRGRLLDHSASEQYGRVDREDTVWIVTVRKGKLFLLGKIEVASVVDQATAEKAIGIDELWESAFHILARAGTAERLREIPISDIAKDLRFESSPPRDRLAIVRGVVDAKQLQTMRWLTAESAELLASRISKIPKRAARSEPSRAASSDRDDRDVLTALARLQEAARRSPDLLHRDYREVDRSRLKMNGFCYALSDCIFHLFLGMFDAYRIGWPDGGSHYFLRFRDGGEILETVLEGGKPSAREVLPKDYNRARRRQFKQKLSVRGAELLRRAGYKLQ